MITKKQKKSAASGTKREGLVAIGMKKSQQDIKRMLLQAQAQMNVCIGRHRTEILNHEKKTTD